MIMIMNDRTLTSHNNFLTFQTSIRTKTGLLKEMNSFYKWWILILGLQWFFLGLCSTNIKAANPHANLCYEALTSIVGLVVAIVLTRIWGCRPLLTFSHCWSALMLIVQSLGLYFDRPDVTLFGHFATNISLKADLGLILLSFVARILYEIIEKNMFCYLKITKGEHFL